jgi:hypothetical protein
MSTLMQPWSYMDNVCSVCEEGRPTKRARVSPAREPSPALSAPSDCESTSSVGSANLRSLLDAVEYEHRRLTAHEAASHNARKMSIAALVNHEEDDTYDPPVLHTITPYVEAPFHQERVSYSLTSKMSSTADKEAAIRDAIQYMITHSGSTASHASKSGGSLSLSNGPSVCTAAATSVTLTTSVAQGTPLMTRVTCWHAAVAQKSYGNEKRFLCPPPVVRVLRSPIQHGADNTILDMPDKPQLSMTVMCENATRELVQKSLLDEHHMGSFKYLHVAGTDKAKQFYLKLKLHGSSSVPFATFDSAPVAIISKPSKKTVKARNISTCIFDNSMVSLFSRINSQTVRTRYLDTEDGRLCAKNSSWSAFTIKVLRDTTKERRKTKRSALATVNGAIPVTYGSRIILTDTATGTQSDVLIICKVERGQVVEGASGPVSQMQKVALRHANMPGSPVYLCAGYDANVVSIGDAMEGNTRGDPTTSPFLTYARPRTSKLPVFGPPSPNCAGTFVDGAWHNEFVDDHLCWTIVGLAKFEYVYAEGLGPVSEPIAPFPSIVGEPVFYQATQRLRMRIKHLNTPVQREPLQIWHGRNGQSNPLNMRVLGTEEDETVLVEVVLPDSSAVLMEKKKEGGGDDVITPNSTEYCSAASPGTTNVFMAHGERGAFIGPLHLVRPDGVIYQLLGDGESIPCRVAGAVPRAIKTGMMTPHLATMPTTVSHPMPLAEAVSSL